MEAAIRSITTSEATLTTAVVEIQVLSLNNKQMTLAVFRQLPIDHEDDDREGDPQLWGIVRYAIKEAGEMWLVFSRAGKLYRRALDLTVDPFADLQKSIWEWRAAVRELETIPVDKQADETKASLQRRKNALAHEEECLTNYRSEERERVAREQGYIDTLPQLFIAV